MNPSPTPSTVKYVGLDVHAQTVAVAIADAAADIRSHGTVPAHSHALDRLRRKLSEDGSEVRCVYDAGPTGFWLARHFAARAVVQDPAGRIERLTKAIEAQVKTGKRLPLVEAFM